MGEPLPVPCTNRCSVHWRIELASVLAVAPLSVVGCEQSPYLPMPPVNKVGAIDGVGTEQELYASVPSLIPVGGPIKLSVHITNGSDHSFRFNALCFGSFNHIGIWVTHSGKEVERTSAGWVWQPVRIHASGFFMGSTVPGLLNPGQSETVEFDLRELFQIVDPGVYTVIVEARKLEGLGYSSAGWPVAMASKATFQLASP